jgi:hypothetical protein
VSASFDLGLKLYHLFLLVREKSISLVFSIFIPEFFDSHGFLDLKISEFLPVIHGFLDSLIDGNKFLIILVFFELGRGLDFGSLDSSIQFLIQLIHLELMLHLQFFDLDKRIVFEVCEMLLPLIVEVLQLRVTNLDILGQLADLDVFPEFILVLNDVLFELADFTHEILKHLILKNIAELLG